MKKLVFLLAIFSLIAPGAYYGMKNISKKVPKYNLFKKDFSTKLWRWGKGWDNTKNYSTLWDKRLFNKTVIPSVKDNKIENTSFIDDGVNVHEKTVDALRQSSKNVKISLSNEQQAQPFIRKIMSRWKEIKDGPLRKFYESIPCLKDRKTVFDKPGFAQTKIKHEEQARGTYWKYFFGGAIAAYLAKLFLGTAQQKPSEQKEIPFDYSLDGELARTMPPKDFVALLHKYGLTVADAVEYQVKKKEEELYKELTELAGFTDGDWRILQNLFNLKKEFLEGHYDESSIAFKGNFDPKTIAMVKSVAQKADIPFHVTVVTNNTKTLNFPAEEWADAAAVVESDLEISLQENGSEFTSFGYINVELYLSDAFLQYDEMTKLYALAHELTHLSQLHPLQDDFFECFLQYGKKFDNNKIKNCLKSLITLSEYQADILILINSKYAQAAKHTYSTLTGPRPDIYIQPKELYTFASRAVGLHKAEAELLIKNRTEDKK